MKTKTIFNSHLQSNLTQALGNIKDFRVVHEALALAGAGRQFAGQRIFQTFYDCGFAATVFSQDQSEWSAECDFLFVALRSAKTTDTPDGHLLQCRHINAEMLLFKKPFQISLENAI